MSAQPRASTPIRIGVDFLTTLGASVIRHDQLGALTRIGRGGQGVVYLAEKGKTHFADAIVYKKYKPDTLAAVDFAALSAMSELVGNVLPTIDAERLISLAAWPCAVVDTDGQPTGFVMPVIPDRFFLTLDTVKGPQRTPGEIQHLLNDPHFVAARGVLIEDRQRLQILAQVAAALTFFHQHDICVGDISPKNLLFALDPRPSVYFVDCDTMGSNGKSALPQLETPGWEVPPGEPPATRQSDTYKLALLALRLLLGDQDTTDPTALSASVPHALRRLVTDTLNQPPNRRPTAAAWSSTLENLLQDTTEQSASSALSNPATPPSAQPVPALRSRPNPEQHKRSSTFAGSPFPPTKTPASAPTRIAAAPKPPSRMGRRAVLAATAVAAIAAGLLAVKQAGPRTGSAAELRRGGLPDAATLIQQALATMRTQHSAHLEQTTTGTIPDWPVKTLSGDVTNQPRNAFVGYANAEISGQKVDAQLTVVDGTLYAALTPNNWLNMGPAIETFDPSTYLDPDNGLINALTGITEPQSQGLETVTDKDGNEISTVRISGMLDGDSANKLFPKAQARVPIPINLWIGQDAPNELVQTVIQPNISATVDWTLSEWGKPVVARKPEGAT